MFNRILQVILLLTALYFILKGETLTALIALAFSNQYETLSRFNDLEKKIDKK